MNIQIDPCHPCLCPSAPCEQCLFGYKSQEERKQLLENILEENKYEGIIRNYKREHGKETTISKKELESLIELEKEINEEIRLKEKKIQNGKKISRDKKDILADTKKRGLHFLFF